MHDQADELRQLVLRTAASARLPAAPPPPIIVVSGGKGGVGSTTIAVNLSVVLARLGRRTILVDADLNQPDATALCNSKEADTVADVLSGHRTVHEVLQSGPGGIQLLPGAWAPQRLTDCPPLAQQRMLAELSRLGAHADAVILDAGNKIDSVTERFWQAADLVVLVTTSEAAAIMDSYAAIKLLAPRGQHPVNICTLVNRAASSAAAQDTHARIKQAAQRFLNLDIHSIPHVPEDNEVVLAERNHQPFVLSQPDCPAARSLELVAEQLLAHAGKVSRGSGSQAVRTSRSGVA